MKYLLLLTILLIPFTTFAHPGRTDAKGGHTCKTNCTSWSLKDGQYHLHNSVVDTMKTAKVNSKAKSK
jgi:hypothetical protein